MKKVFFISDLHLGAAYYKDKRAKEMEAVRFLRWIKPQASALYLMGDILDYWFEYRTVVPRGYVRFFGALADLVDSGVRVVWYIGNHDIWLFDYLRDELGIEVVDGWRVEDIMGKRFFLNHGDGVGRLKPGFRFIRHLFRNKVCQKLYSGIHPRWTVPLAHLWSHHNREIKSIDRPWEGATEPLAVFASHYYNDVDPTVNYFVFGHLHVLVEERLSPTCLLVILGDWIKLNTYAEFDGESLRLCHYDSAESEIK